MTEPHSPASPIPSITTGKRPKIGSPAARRFGRPRLCTADPKAAEEGEQAMPDHDLVALWEAHCRYEFETRDVDATMATMTAEPYVNHVPTLTGGVGHDQLKRV